MSDEAPRRLRDEADGELRAVLASASADQPTESELKAIAGGLTGLSPPGKIPTRWRPWVLPGGGFVAAVVLMLALRLAAHVEPANEVRSPAVDPARAAVAPAPPPAPAEDPVVRPAVPSPPAVPAHPTQVQPAAPPALPPAKPLPSEFELIDRAFKAARGGDPAGALVIIEEHARRFEHGALEQEREVLRIEALVRLGRGAEAREAFTSFEAKFPGSGHRVRILELLDAGGQ